VTTARETPVWVICRQDAPAARAQALSACGVEVIRSASAADGRLDIGAVLALLAERGITRVMVEGGPTLAAALVTADLVDEAILFRAPKLIGPDGILALEGLPLAALTQSSRLVVREREQVGLDTVETFERP
jgi:diaminohydroxyphosphoribosylaminopyrimidine deaminase/5-amino-6-(5-phosphoribosylamino)uracil reductase